MTDTPSRLIRVFSTVRDGNAKEPPALARLLRKNGVTPEQLVTGKQVHETKIVIVEARTSKLFHATDGFLTDKPGIALGVYSADCMPILLWSKDENVVGALHAGWRGVSRKILTRAIGALRSRWGLSPRDIQIHLGPHIRQCCYAVKEETARRFSKVASETRADKIYLSLQKAIQKEAGELGVPQKAIGFDPRCTFCDKDFFSFRKTKTEERMLSYILKTETHEKEP